MSLTGLPLLVLVAVLAVLAPAATAWSWWRTRDSASTLRLVGGFGAVLGCQLLAVLLTFLAVNRTYAFYASWGDLFGWSSSPAKIKAQGLITRGEGSVQVLDVRGRVSGTHAQVLLWLPPQYAQPAYADARFPVLVVLPGQPSGVETMFRHFDFGTVASEAVNSRRVKPFIAVFPPLMTNPPRDTECTDIPGGPRAESWLSTDVPAAVLEHTKADPNPAHWSVMGWSTGAFCGAKLLLKHPQRFTAAAGLGGYYEPITDSTTGNLFRGSRIQRDDNSPVWLYQHRGLAPGHGLLLVSGREDAESWPATARMLSVTRGNRSVFNLVFPTGGHNYRNYKDYLPDVLGWFGGRGAFG